jgi:hypothetical protein
MCAGFLLWALLNANDRAAWALGGQVQGAIAFAYLVAGLAVLQGASEAFIQSVERVGHRLGWDGFTAGTLGALVASFPEFIVIGFLVAVEPIAAFVTAAVTVFNNAICFALYTGIVPRDERGQVTLPPAMAKAGSDMLVAGSGVAFLGGVVMLIHWAAESKPNLVGGDLVVVGVVLLVVYAAYTYTLVRFYRIDESVAEAVTANRAPGWANIIALFTLGMIGAWIGGGAVVGFADTAIHELNLAPIPTSAMLAFFAGSAGYFVLWKAHRRRAYDLALSHVFGGISQAMFVSLPIALVLTAIFGFATGTALYAVPITLETALLMLLMFPMFYVLHEYMNETHPLSHLNIVAITGIYGLLFYFLLFS